MECPKCHRKMLGDVDMGRQNVPGGGAAFLGEPVYRCYNCNTRVAIERPVVMRLSADDFGVKRSSQRAGGRKAGFTATPAAGMAVRFFDAITVEVERNAGFAAITRMIIADTGCRSFMAKSLRKHYYKEVERRAVADMGVTG